MEPVDERWKDRIILGSLFLVRLFRFALAVRRRFGERIENRTDAAGSRGVCLSNIGVAYEGGRGGASNF